MRGPKMTEKNSIGKSEDRIEVPSDLNILPADIQNVMQENEYFKLLCINKAQTRIIESLQQNCATLKSEIDGLKTKK